jgi:carboxyl-terminal processing protease
MVLKTLNKKTMKLLAKNNKVCFFVVIFAMVFVGCDKNNPTPDPDPVEQIPASVLTINKFIHDNMETYYLWNESMPYLDYTKQSDSFKYFDSLLYKPTDRWSFITDDYAALANSYQGIEESMGHSYILYKYSNSDGVFGIIQFVYPNSPASEAGLKRGDLFTAIDGTDLDINNYNTLLDKKKYLLTIAKLQGNTVVPVQDVNLTARVITQNPVLLYDTLNIDGTIIGYLVYKNFLDNFNDSLTNAFSWLKAAGINEMVLDLRYNNGGAISSMQHLASIIAPFQQITKQDIIISDKYNTILSQYYNSNGISTSTKFKSTGLNMNLNRIYVLTGPNTASASEALIIGLKPYMDVITLGDTTHGKYTGAYVIYDTEKKHNWAIQPIVFKYSNALGFTDFPNGLAPTFIGNDDLYNPLGDPKEGLLALTIQKIKGGKVGVAPKSAAIQLKAVQLKSFDNNKPRQDIPLLKENLIPIK